MSPKGFGILGDRNFIRKFYNQFPQYKEFWDNYHTKDFAKVIKQFHNDFIDAVISNRHGADLPLSMGNLSIISYKTPEPYVNFTQYPKLKQVSNFTNNHTDGLSCKIVYNSHERRYRFKDKRIWAFHPEKPFKSKVSKAFAKNYTRYVFSPNRRDSFYELLDYKLRDEADVRIEKFLKTYDEFALI